MFAAMKIYFFRSGHLDGFPIAKRVDLEHVKRVLAALKEDNAHNAKCRRSEVSTCPQRRHCQHDHRPHAVVMRC